MRHIQGKAEIQHKSAVALPMAGVQTGTAIGINLARPARGIQSQLGFITRLKFYFGEFTGLLFILASIAFIFSVPSAAARRGELRALVFRAIKRTIDVAGAVVGILLTLPVWAVVPILIKWDSAGPVFYTQTRVGVNRRRSGRRYHQRADGPDRRACDRRREDHLGRPFRVAKFRTMVQNAEQATGPVWATRDDPRITRFGKVLRKTRLDELPQFFNILRGDMSLVGPRPERPDFVRVLSGRVQGYSTRLQVKPGLTGLAQVENGYDSSIASVVDKVRFDLQYIRNWTLLSDIRIILKTFVVVITGRGAC